MTIERGRDAATAANESIAVVGVACRLPGGLRSPRELLPFLRAKRDGVCRVPADRWSLARYYDPDDSVAGRMLTQYGSFLTEDIFSFDPTPFGISPREAEAIYPQQTFVLQTAWEALEDAGIPLERAKGSATGVFVGAFAMDDTLHGLSATSQRAIDLHTHLTSATMLSARVAYTFDLSGPTLTVDTACSSSLVAVHLARQSLLLRECNAALVGGVHLMQMPAMMISLSKGHFVAPDGRSKAFDAAANGYGRGEGVVILVLKRLSDALADGDRIYATLVGSGVNQDGKTDGITVPSETAQERLIRSVCSRAGVDPAQIAYVEAHGTGTPVGDPIEARVLGRVYGQAAEAPCALGSIKTNIGHLEAAAGVAGLLKVVMMRDAGALVPQIGPNQINPAIDLRALNLRFASNEDEWPSRGPLAAVNSFGYGGTNAHVLVGPAPRVERKQSPSNKTFVPLSAYSAAALSARAEQLLATMREEEDVEADALAHSLQTRRTHLPYRAGLLANNRAELEAALESLAAGVEDDRVVQSSAPADAGEIAWVFTGMGPQRARMGCELYASDAVFRAEVDAIDAIFAPVAGWSVAQTMCEEADEARARRNDVAQVMNFVLQAGIAAVLRDRGWAPSAIVGHSVGEIAAAYVAGSLSREDAVSLILVRARATQRIAGRGSMLAVGASEEDARLLIGTNDDVVVAAINAANSVALSGNTEQLQNIEWHLLRIGVFARSVGVEVAYHGPHLDLVRDELLAGWAQIRSRAPSTPVYSTMTGRRLDLPQDAHYWWSNARGAVQFDAAIRAMVRDGVRHFVEIGPHPVLAASIRSTLQQLGVRGSTLFAMKRGAPELRAVQRLIAEAFCRAGQLSWSDEPARPYSSGAYPWQPQRYLSESAEMRAERLATDRLHPLLDQRLPTHNKTWTATVDASANAALWDHKVEQTPIAPGAMFVDIGLALARAQSSGEHFEVESIFFERTMMLTAQTRVLTEQRDRRVTVHSSLNGESWSENASLEISSAPRSRRAARDLASIRGRFTDYPASKIYRAFQARGLDYGPAFRTVRRAWVSGEEVLAHVAIDDGSERAPEFVIAPALLDGAFQTLVALRPEEDHETLLPVSIDRVTHYGPIDREVFSLARLRERDETSILADIELLSTTGECLASVEGLRCQRVAKSHSEDAQVELLVDRWQPAQNDAIRRRGTWAVLGSSACASEVREMLAEVAPTAASPARLDELDVGNTHHVFVLDENIEAIFETIEAIAKLALALERGQWSTLVVVTHNARATSRSDRCSPLQRAIWGAVRSIARELPSLEIRLVDLDAEWTAHALERALLLLRDDELAIRGNEVLCARLTRVDPSSLECEVDERVERVVSSGSSKWVTDQRDRARTIAAERWVVLQEATQQRDGLCLAWGRDAHGRWHVGASTHPESTLDIDDGMLAATSDEPTDERAITAAVLVLLSTAHSIPVGSTVMLAPSVEHWRPAVVAAGYRAASLDERAQVVLCWTRSEAVSLCERRSAEAATFIVLTDHAQDSTRVPLSSRQSLRAIAACDWLRAHPEPLAAALATVHHRLTEFVDFRKHSASAALVRAIDRRTVHPTARDVWWIVGGTRGFALEATFELAARGARRFVLSSRAAAVDEAERERLSALVRAGCEVRLVPMDVSERASVQRAYDELCAEGWAPTAIIHAAVAYHDEPLSALSKRGFDAVFRAKARGALLLDEVSRARPIEHFILCSSIASTFGNVGQCAYAASNALLDGLAERRRAEGLAATSVAWGAIGGAGILAREEATARHLELMGLRPLSASHAWRSLFSLPTAPLPTVTIAAIEWDKLSTAMQLGRSARVRELLPQQSSTSAVDSVLALIEGMEPEQQLSTLSTKVASITAAVLRVTSESIDVARPLRDYGLDSLLGAELRLALIDELKADVPTMSLLAGACARDIARSLLASLHDRAAPNN